MLDGNIRDRDTVYQRRRDRATMDARSQIVEPGSYYVARVVVEKITHRSAVPAGGRGIPPADDKRDKEEIGSYVVKADSIEQLVNKIQGVAEVAF